MMIVLLLNQSSLNLKMPSRRRRKGRKTKYVTKRGLPFQLMKFAEIKFIDTATPSTGLLVPAPSTFATNTFIPLAIQRGDGEAERIGNIVQVSGYYCRFVYDGLEASVSNFLRIVIYSPKQDQQSQESPCVDMVNVPDPRRFTIWYDKTVLAPNSAGGSKGVLVVKKRFKPYLKVEWDGSLLTDFTRGNVLIQVLSLNNEGIRLFMDFRMYFRDV